jgi:flagellar hook-associated protein 2
LQSSLLNDVTYTTSDSLSESSGINSLAALGITMNNDGTLSLNSSTLSSALTSNPAAVQNFFQNSNMTGFANSLNTSLSSLSAPTTGILSLDLTQNQTQQSALTSEISDFQAQMASQQTALDQEFDQVNANLEQYPYTLLEVTAALGSLSGNSSTTTSNSNSNTTPTSGTATS